MSSPGSEPADSAPHLPTYEDVVAAAGRLEGVVHRTPVMTSRRIDDVVGGRVFFKCENLQRIGAFKFRGGYNALSQFHGDQRRAGVVTFSSGNHAQAIALAARLLDIPATIVMPTDAPSSKVAATRGYGAEIVAYDRYAEDRAAIGRRLAAERGLTLVPPYDHPDVIPGQGTAAKELFEQVGALDDLYVPLGGGGLLAGTALATRALAADCHLVGVEPEAGDDGRRSFASGEVVTIAPPRTIADGAATPSLGELTFAIIADHVDEVVTASDDELVACMRRFATTMKLVVEPTGCLGLAAVLAAAAAEPDRFAGRRVGVVVSGGNVDLDRYATLLAGGPPAP